MAWTTRPHFARTGQSIRSPQEGVSSRLFLVSGALSAAAGDRAAARARRAGDHRLLTPRHGPPEVPPSVV